jgi:hypothetical protein
MFVGDRCDKRIDSFLEFGRNQVFSVFGAIDRVDIVVGVGMARKPEVFAQDNRFSAAPPALERSRGRPSPSGLGYV